MKMPEVHYPHFILADKAGKWFGTKNREWEIVWKHAESGRQSFETAKGASD